MHSSHRSKCHETAAGGLAAPLPVAAKQLAHQPTSTRCAATRVSSGRASAWQPAFAQRRMATPYQRGAAVRAAKTALSGVTRCADGSAARGDARDRLAAFTARWAGRDATASAAAQPCRLCLASNQGAGWCWGWSNGLPLAGPQEPECRPRDGGAGARRRSLCCRTGCLHGRGTPSHERRAGRSPAPKPRRPWASRWRPGAGSPLRKRHPRRR